jgi:hypothetical protein
MNIGTILKVAAVSCLALAASAVQATPPEVRGEGARTDITVPTALLDGTKIMYTLVDGQSFEVAFDKGIVNWRGLAGSAKGKSGRNVSYAAHKLDNGVYRVRWNDARMDEDFDFVTLLIDLNKQTVFDCSLLNYGDKSAAKPEVRFIPGVIHAVTQS